jgi:hypothetical protein
MAELIKLHGEKQVVAMVLMLAHASFQDRLANTLGLAVEDGGPLPPQPIRFARKPAQVPATARPKPQGTPAAAPERVLDSEWTALDFGQLQEAMAKQKARPPRIPVPSWEDVRQYLPPTYPKDRPLRIKWSRVCLGYQPELATAWGACLRTFAEESGQDRVFEESLFWVITRTLHCFY